VFVITFWQLVFRNAITIKQADCLIVLLKNSTFTQPNKQRYLLHLSSINLKIKVMGQNCSSVLSSDVKKRILLRDEKKLKNEKPKSKKK
jgi:hypothetical protein